MSKGSLMSRGGASHGNRQPAPGPVDSPDPKIELDGKVTVLHPDIGNPDRRGNGRSAFAPIEESKSKITAPIKIAPSMGQKSLVSKGCIEGCIRYSRRFLRMPN